MLNQRRNHPGNCIIDHCDVDLVGYFNTGHDQKRVEAKKKGSEKIDREGLCT